MERGYIKLWRAIWDNPHWNHKPFSPARAWIDMIMLANYKGGTYHKRGNRIDLLRGQLAWSVKGLADRWGWSQGKVSRYLDELKMDNQIEYQKSNLTTLITIVNYDIYQGDGEQNDTQTETKRGANGEQTETKRRHLNKDKKVNKEKNEKKLSIYSAEREEIISDLNEVFGTRYLPTSEAIVKLMNARLEEGYSVEDFRIVHRNMKQAWENDIKMARFMRPQTLYTGNFSSYLNWKSADNSLSPAGRATAQAAQKFLEESDAE